MDEYLGGKYKRIVSLSNIVMSYVVGVKIDCKRNNRQLSRAKILNFSARLSTLDIIL